jgi:hypothetical protein
VNFANVFHIILATTKFLIFILGGGKLIAMNVYKICKGLKNANFLLKKMGENSMKELREWSRICLLACLLACLLSPLDMNSGETNRT